jgi:hypothetical protein
MRKPLIILLILVGALPVRPVAQELFVFSEPASNMPSNSLSLKLAERFVANDGIYGRASHRLTPELMFGISAKWMVHVLSTFSNMHTRDMVFESYGAYAKYRFLSNDDLHRHFRMAAFVTASRSRVPFHYDEVSLMGDKSGVETGLIATQLWNRFAISGTVGHTWILDPSRKNDVIYVPARDYRSFNYVVSAGLLVFPQNYTDYKQTNLNLYLELLGQNTLDQGRYYLDLAPAIQLIFNSNFKINLGARMQLKSDMDRMARNTWLLSLERTLLNAFKK